MMFKIWYPMLTYLLPFPSGLHVNRELNIADRGNNILHVRRIPRKSSPERHHWCPNNILHVLGSAVLLQIVWEPVLQCLVSDGHCRLRLPLGPEESVENETQESGGTGSGGGGQLGLQSNMNVQYYHIFLNKYWLKTISYDARGVYFSN